MQKIVNPVALLLCLTTCNALADADAVVGAHVKVLGKSLGEYSNLWWQWATSMPASESPVRDKTGQKCDVNQTGQVWFLAGGYGSSKISRKCSVPQGQYLFFPVINMVNFPSGTAQTTCQAAKARSALNNDNLRAFVVSIDDNKIVNPAFHRYSSPDCFDMLARATKNPRATSLYPSATDGYWVMLKPLPLGRHNIKFRAEYANPDQAYGLMVQDIEYQIDIVESTKQPPQFKRVEEKHRPESSGI